MNFLAILTASTSVGQNKYQLDDQVIKKQFRVLVTTMLKSSHIPFHINYV